MHGNSNIKFIFSIRDCCSEILIFWNIPFRLFWLAGLIAVNHFLVEYDYVTQFNKLSHRTLRIVAAPCYRVSKPPAAFERAWLQIVYLFNPIYTTV